MHPGETSQVRYLAHPWKRIFTGTAFATNPGMGAISPPARPVMSSTRSPYGLTVRAPAKVNLFLEVLGNRPDGYHELATLMIAVGLFDTLEFKEDAARTITLDLVPGQEE